MFWCAAVAVQYGGQPQTGMGVPAVGMAVPNYSGQPQYGFANQEVAWYGLCRRFSNSYSCLVLGVNMYCFCCFLQVAFIICSVIFIELNFSLSNLNVV